MMLIRVVFIILFATCILGDEDTINIPKEEVLYKPPKITGNTFMAEPFDKGLKNWVKSEAKKEDTDEDIAKYSGEWQVKESDEPIVKNDKGLVLTTKARHAAISSKLTKPFTFSGKPLIIQYEVQFQHGMDCGGAYVKLLTDKPGLDLKQITDKTPYTIMFGPDACGADKKLHFIMRHKNPKTGEFEEKHAKKPSGPLDFYSDKQKTHLFRLTVNPDNTFEVHVDEAVVNSGSLLEDMEPPVNPPAEIDDPEDFKPADWDDREKIADPEASKPIDWDEDAPEHIPDEDAEKPSGWLDDEAELIDDPTAEKPADWDEDMDGEWEAPKIDNPACESAPGCGEWKRPTKRNPEFKGKWRAPMIENPDYSGVWAPRRISNPNYFEDNEPYKMTAIGAVAFELWSMTDGILFDNILITDDTTVAEDFTVSSWHLKRDAELAATAASRQSWGEWAGELSESKPWIWAVLILGLLIPLAFIYFCCCGSSQNDDSKKTDAVTPDDADTAANDQPEEEEASNPAGGDNSGTKRDQSPIKSARAELSKEAESSDEEEKGEDSQDGQEADNASAPELSAPEEVELSQEEQPERRTSPRKRRPRKD